MTSLVTIPQQKAYELEKSQSRMDAEYIICRAWDTGPKNSIPASEVLVYREGSNVPDCQEEFKYCEIGNIDSLGRFEPTTLRWDAQDLEVDPDAQKNNQRLWDKINKRDITKHDGPCVLVPKTRPYLKRFGLLTGVEGEEKLRFTKALFAFYPGAKLRDATLAAESGKSSSIVRLEATCLLFIALKEPLSQWIASLARWGKTYPTLEPREVMESHIQQKLLRAATSDERKKRACELAMTVKDRATAETKFSAIMEKNK